MADFNPAEVAFDILVSWGFDFNKVYNGRDGIVRDQLKLLTKLSNTLGPYEDPNTGKTKTLKDNVYNTVHKLNGSANKKNIDFAANIKNTMVGTVQASLIDSIEQTTTPKDKQETMIRWLPSTADEQDLVHALNYGKTMSMDAALKKGLGTRYGCKCGMEIIKTSAKVESELAKLSSI